MDELAHAAQADPLAFRLAHLKNERLRAVLENAAKEFGWDDRHRQAAANTGVGLACGTEKSSYVATCVEVEVDRSDGAIHVRRVCQAFECGAVLNPANLVSQNQGCILMGLGGALMEEIRFADGAILNPRFATYPVPRFQGRPADRDPPGTPSRSRLGGRRRNADRGYRPRDRQRRLPRHRRPAARHAAPRAGTEESLDGVGRRVRGGARAGARSHECAARTLV